jgi:hypothetical protein
MKRATIVRSAFTAALVLLALAAARRVFQQYAQPAAEAPRALAPPATAAGVRQSFLYGRITTASGAIYEGRLRWGGDQEALWGNYFNGAKRENPWAAYVAPERLPKESRPVKIFGLVIADREWPIDLGRLFMARFGDIARIETRARDVRVTLKSGTEFVLDRFEASDFDDGVRVWDDKRGVVDLDSLLIRSIELLPTPRSDTGSGPLYGTVRTRQGDFTGLVQWDREQCLGADELRGHAAEGEIRLRFDAIRSIAPSSRDSFLVMLLDGREILLNEEREAGGSRGIYVDDPRYGRVLVSWRAFEGVEFGPGGGPAYGEFPPGSPLRGAVTMRTGRRLAGRLVYDLDESEVTETLDASFAGVTYTIPFGLIASITIPGTGERATVTLRGGEKLRLERTGDLGEKNGGMLIFAAGQQRPEYVPWNGVQRIDLDPPAAMYPPFSRR